MSAWLCGNKTLSLVVDIVKSDEFKEFYNNPVYSSMSCDELINILGSINVRNLQYLYESFPSPVEVEIMNNRKYVGLDVSDVQRCKSLHCYLYQSCDSEDCYNHPLYQLLNEFSNFQDNLHGYLESEEYDACEWDMDD